MSILQYRATRLVLPETVGGDTRVRAVCLNDRYAYGYTYRPVRTGFRFKLPKPGDIPWGRVVGEPLGDFCPAAVNERGLAVGTVLDDVSKSPASCLGSGRVTARAECGAMCSAWVVDEGGGAYVVSEEVDEAPAIYRMTRSRAREVSLSIGVGHDDVITLSAVKGPWLVGNIAGDESAPRAFRHNLESGTTFMLEPLCDSRTACLAADASSETIVGVAEAAVTEKYPKGWAAVRWPIEGGKPTVIDDLEAPTAISASGTIVGEPLSEGSPERHGAMRIVNAGSRGEIVVTRYVDVSPSGRLLAVSNEGKLRGTWLLDPIEA